MASRGARRHLVSLFGPGPEVPDGDGGYTQTRTALNPATRMAEIKTATVRDLERVTANTVMSTEALIMTMDFHAGISLKTSADWEDQAGRSHSASVTFVSNPDQRCIDSVLIAVEVVQ